jgi:dynein heavy chain, axonemal
MAKVPEYEDRLSKFERMCVVKTFREDRTLVAAAEYVADALGQRFVESVPLNIDRAWTESTKTSPLICLLSRGSDPTKLIEDLAKKKKIKVCYNLLECLTVFSGVKGSHQHGYV